MRTHTAFTGRSTTARRALFGLLAHLGLIDA